jgi:hypothetical protein
MTDELRRVDDRRIADLGEQVVGLDRKVTEIRDMLISEPEASPLGRYLLKRADQNQASIREVASANSAKIENLDTRVDGLEQTRDQARGAYRALLFAQFLITLLLGLLALYQFLLAHAVPKP